jgi:Tfp pilus assembly pilus retraction ATPase PilT
MIDLNRSLAELVRAGEITVENARSHASSIQNFERMI